MAGDGPPVVTADLRAVGGRVRNWCWGSLPGNPRCCCVRVCQSPVLTRGSGGWRALSHWRGVPLQEVAGLMKVLYERVAGIDVHKDTIKVAIRSPGEKPQPRKTEILEFRAFTGCSRRRPASCAAAG